MDNAHEANGIEGVEIERKWRLSCLPPHDILGRGYLRFQGYLIAHEGFEMRIRNTRDGRFVLGMKDEGTIQRHEWERLVDQWAVKELWVLTKERRLVRVQYDVHIPPTPRLSIVTYQEALKPLITMECEFPSQEAAAAFEMPPWISVLYAREVTDDQRYKSKNLALTQKIPED